MSQYLYTNATDALQGLSALLLNEGNEIGSRNGRVKERTHVMTTLLRPWERYIQGSSRNASLPAQVAETMWVLSGRDDVGWLRNYLPRAVDFSDDGERWRGAYGKRIRRYGKGIDQWAHVVDLLRTDPDTRQAVISIYDPEIDTVPGLDIPCNNWIQFLLRDGRLHMMVTIRSNDLIWGWSGINQFEWSAMQEITAAWLGVPMGDLTFATGSLHVYDRHWGKAKRIAEDYTMTTATYGHVVPRFSADVCPDLASFDDLAREWFRIELLCRQGEFATADELIADFPDPMLQAWARVIRWYWSCDAEYGSVHFGSTALFDPLCGTPDKKWEPSFGPWDAPEATPEPGPAAGEDFWDFAARLHEEKHVAYGDSWKRRGEMLGIMANIARKVDRLGAGETRDETSADTAMDLLIYLIKYRLWLGEKGIASIPSCVRKDYGDPITDLAAPVGDYLRALRSAVANINFPRPIEEREKMIQMVREQFNTLEDEVETHSAGRYNSVNLLIALAHELAVSLFTIEHDDFWKAVESA